MWQADLGHWRRRVVMHLAVSSVALCGGRKRVFEEDMMVGDDILLCDCHIPYAEIE